MNILLFARRYTNNILLYIGNIVICYLIRVNLEFFLKKLFYWLNNFSIEFGEPVALVFFIHCCKRCYKMSLFFIIFDRDPKLRKQYPTLFIYIHLHTPQQLYTNKRYFIVLLLDGFSNKLIRVSMQLMQHFLSNWW